MDADRYSAVEGRVYLSGVQALVRLMIVQRLRDHAAGLHTAGFASGYRGSPLGGLDEAFWKAAEPLGRHGVHFQPGVNEELAATAVWGTQQVQLVAESKVDGVFALWYGKGPGVDRSADVLKHLNHAGTSRHGGVLLVAGDDHGAYSSTLPHQSDHIFRAAMIPVLYPSNVAEYIELGLHGLALSRYSGCAVGLKALADTVESSASIDADPFTVQIRLPEDHTLPPEGLNCRSSSAPLGAQARSQELLMQQHKRMAVMAYARANRLNRTVGDAPDARFGIVASGKSFADVCEALALLGLHEGTPARSAIRLFKVSMSWPLEPEGVRTFASGLQEIVVVEEKRDIVEAQLRTLLYAWPDGQRPRIIGKADERGEFAAPTHGGTLPPTADFSVLQIARLLASRLQPFLPDRAVLGERLAGFDPIRARVRRAAATPVRAAHYCSGCPHSRSTRVPPGSVALAGIGCHIMATSIFPEHNKTFTQMGGEGAAWIGQSPFSKVSHVFANLGDGTYFHSGHLAIRAAVAAKVNITYKILYNDAVAMTGGQPVDGTMTVPMMAQQLRAEGVQRIAIVSEDIQRHAGSGGLPRGITLHPREELEGVQRELRTVSGTSVLIYDQVCAAEKRRRIGRGLHPPTKQRVFINPLVCEGCGDCGVQSNCSSIEPLDTPWGRKRAVNQRSCNHDQACMQGFCPSFVTVEGGALRKPTRPSPRATATSELLPCLPAHGELQRPYNILVCGIGGTGVITVGVVLGTAAHLEGKTVSVLDMTGMSQKNGAVTCHIRIVDPPATLHAQRIPSGAADLLLGCDMLTSASPDAIDKIRPDRTHVLVNSHEQWPGHAIRNTAWEFPSEEVLGLLRDAAGARLEQVDATAAAKQQLGDEMATNLLMLGYAYQRGFVPLGETALMRAIELNGVAVDENKAAFLHGRQMAAHGASRQGRSLAEHVITVARKPSLDELIEERRNFLADYQNAAYAQRYVDFVHQVWRVECDTVGKDRLARAVAHQLSRLMAYKDEYEVARLFVHADFQKALEETFEGPVRLGFHLAPPLLRQRDAEDRPVKRKFGPRTMVLFRLLAMLRWARGTPLDLFGHTEERRTERSLVGEYMNGIESVLCRLSSDNHATAVQFANVPDRIRGFGHVKAGNIAKARAQWSTLLAQIAAAPASSGTVRPTPSGTASPQAAFGTVDEERACAP